jgi:secondary thiamine-phosphate synthase enzyme
MIYSEYVNIETKGYSDILDMTDDVKRILIRSGINNGIVTLGVMSSTSAITTLEFDLDLFADFRKVLEIIVSSCKGGNIHNEKWRGSGGFSHICSSLLGASKTIPIASKSIMLGTWQRIILVDFDNRPRSRKVFVQVFGE